MDYKREPPPGNRTRKKFIRFDTGKASRRRIKSSSARPLSLRNAASAASRFLLLRSFISREMQPQSQRQIFHSIYEIFRQPRFGGEFQIVHASADAHGQLMNINDPGEDLTTPLPPVCFRQKVFVLAERHPVQRRCPIEQVSVFQAGCPIRLSGQHIHPAQEQPVGDGVGHMDIQVKADAHGSLPNSRNRFRKGVSPAAVRNWRYFAQASLNLRVHVVLVVVVVTQSRVNLGERQVRMLEMDFFGTPAVGNPIGSYFDDLRAGIVHPRHATLIQPDVSRF